MTLVLRMPMCRKTIFKSCVKVKQRIQICAKYNTAVSAYLCLDSNVSYGRHTGIPSSVSVKARWTAVRLKISFYQFIVIKPLHTSKTNTTLIKLHNVHSLIHYSLLPGIQIRHWQLNNDQSPSSKHSADRTALNMLPNCTCTPGRNRDDWWVFRPLLVAFRPLLSWCHCLQAVPLVVSIFDCTIRVHHTLYLLIYTGRYTSCLGRSRWLYLCLSAAPPWMPSWALVRSIGQSIDFVDQSIDIVD